MSNRKTWRRFAFAAWLGLVGIAITACNLAGCSGQGAGSTSSGSQSIDEIVLALTQGASPEDVEDSLGNPASESAYDNEIILRYPPWQLSFQEGKLRQRTREVRTGKVSPSGPSLDRKVLLRLAHGMTVRVVRKTLGTPEVYEEIDSFGRKPAVVLRYAYWELYFQNGWLVRRTQN